MNIKSFMGAKTRWALLGPVVIAAILTAASLRFKAYDASLWATVRSWYKTEPLGKVLKEYVVEAPAYEEITSRGPAYAFLLAALFWTWHRNRKTGTTPFIARRICGVALHDIIAWIIAVTCTYYWATTEHPYPLPTFAMGIIFTAVMIKTRNILWNIGAHMFFNLCVTMSVRFGGTLLN